MCESGGVPAIDGRAADRHCMWGGCGLPAMVDVMVGDLVRRERRHHGRYCVQHAVAESRALRTRVGGDVWFAVIGAGIVADGGAHGTWHPPR